MAIELIIEDGSIIDNANTYVSISEANLLIEQRGLSEWPIPENSDAEDTRVSEKSIALIRGADYLNGLHWTGKKAVNNRIMAFPRVGAVDKDGYKIEENEIPRAVILANAYLGYLVFTGTDIQPILERGNRIASESVGSLSTSYFENGPARDIFSFLADLLYGLCSDFDEFSGTATGVYNKGAVLIKVTQ
jgi:hypothetical protein